MRIAEAHKQLGNLFWRFVPIGTLVAFASYILGTQVLSPHRRIMKIAVMAFVAIIMWRFEVILSLYIFVVLFTIPSGIAITSTNVALITLIFLFWVIRANARHLRILPKTPLDTIIALFVLAYVVSFFNVETTEGIVLGAKIVWKQLTALALFYLIVLAVDDEKKLETFTIFMAASAAFLAFTAVIELYAPGATIIPGWIKLHQRIGMGTLGYRLEGIRLGGAVGNHGLLSDYCTLSLFMMTFHFVRARNVIVKMTWLLLSGMTFVILMATANRGAFLGLTIGVVYAMWVFRSHMSLVRYTVIASTFVLLFSIAQIIIQQHSIAVSVVDRLLNTRMVGIVPESREGLYEELLARCMDHIFIGHGPHFKVTAGLYKLFWPHNGYLFYLYTIGMLGLGAFLGICYRVFRLSRLYAKKVIHNTKLGMIMSVLHVQLVTFLIVQLRTDHQRDHDYVYIYIVWILFGLIVATSNLIRRRLAEPEVTPPVPVASPALQR